MAGACGPADRSVKVDTMARCWVLALLLGACGPIAYVNDVTRHAADPVVAGCAGSTVRTQTTSTSGLITTARDNGAQRCAPVELAMAESHNDFATHALDEGNYFEASNEAEVAEKNARIAIDKSPRDKCL